MVLQEVLVLLEGGRTRLPVLNFLIKIFFFLCHFDPFLVQTVNFLIQFVNHLILESVVAVLSVEFLNERLQLLLFRLHVDRVALEVVMLLLFQLAIELRVEFLDHGVEVSLSLRDFGAEVSCKVKAT